MGAKMIDSLGTIEEELEQLDLSTGEQSNKFVWSVTTSGQDLQTFVRIFSCMQHDLCWLLRNKQWVIQREACLEMARVYLVAMLSLDLPLHSFRPFLLLELFHFDGDDDKKDGDDDKMDGDDDKMDGDW